jgi:hypothetical protein
VGAQPLFSGLSQQVRELVVATGTCLWVVSAPPQAQVLPTQRAVGYSLLLCKMIQLLSCVLMQLHGVYGGVEGLAGGAESVGVWGNELLKTADTAAPGSVDETRCVFFVDWFLWLCRHVGPEAV